MDLMKNEAREKIRGRIKRDFLISMGGSLGRKEEINLGKIG